MKYWIEVNGKKHGLISRYMIPRWLVSDYVDHGSVIYYPGGYVECMYQEYCDLCLRMKSETTKQRLTACQDTKINHNAGYPLKVCLDCYYYIEYDNGNHSLPKTFMKQFESGFVPHELDKYRYL